MLQFIIKDVESSSYADRHVTILFSFPRFSTINRLTRCKKKPTFPNIHKCTRENGKNMHNCLPYHYLSIKPQRQWLFFMAILVFEITSCTIKIFIHIYLLAWTSRIGLLDVNKTRLISNAFLLDLRTNK